MRNLVQELNIALVSRRGMAVFRSLQDQRDLRVNLGSGPRDVRPGWVNIDLAPAGLGNVGNEGDEVANIVRYDLRLGLPLADHSCAFIYSSHFFEHLEYKTGVRLMRECYRTLQPGGVFRLVLPNFRVVADAYLRGDGAYLSLLDDFIREACPEIMAGTASIVDYVNYAAHQCGEHKYIYDEEKVSLLLHKIGFRQVSVSAFTPGLDEDIPTRRRYSFYMEAVKWDPPRPRNKHLPGYRHLHSGPAGRGFWTPCLSTSHGAVGHWPARR